MPAVAMEKATAVDSRLATCDGTNKPAVQPKVADDGPTSPASPGEVDESDDCMWLRRKKNVRKEKRESTEISPPYSEDKKKEFRDKRRSQSMDVDCTYNNNEGTADVAATKMCMPTNQGESSCSNAQTPPVSRGWRKLAAIGRAMSLVDDLIQQRDWKNSTDRKTQNKLNKQLVKTKAVWKSYDYEPGQLDYDKINRMKAQHKEKLQEKKRQQSVEVGNTTEGNPLDMNKFSQLDKLAGDKEKVDLVIRERDEKARVEKEKMMRRQEEKRQIEETQKNEKKDTVEDSANEHAAYVPQMQPTLALPVTKELGQINSLEHKLTINRDGKKQADKYEQNDEKQLYQEPTEEQKQAKHKPNTKSLKHQLATKQDRKKQADKWPPEESEQKHEKHEEVEQATDEKPLVQKPAEQKALEKHTKSLKHQLTTNQYGRKQADKRSPEENEQKHEKHEEVEQATDEKQVDQKQAKQKALEKQRKGEENKPVLTHTQPNQHTRNQAEHKFKLNKVEENQHHLPEGGKQKKSILKQSESSQSDEMNAKCESSDNQLKKTEKNEDCEMRTKRVQFALRKADPGELHGMKDEHKQSEQRKGERKLTSQKALADIGNEYDGEEDITNNMQKSSQNRDILGQNRNTGIGKASAKEVDQEGKQKENDTKAEGVNRETWKLLAAGAQKMNKNNESNTIKNEIVMVEVEEEGSKVVQHDETWILVAHGTEREIRNNKALDVKRRGKQQWVSLARGTDVYTEHEKKSHKLRRGSSHEREVKEELLYLLDLQEMPTKKEDFVRDFCKVMRDGSQGRFRETQRDCYESKKTLKSQRTNHVTYCITNIIGELQGTAIHLKKVLQRACDAAERN